jgi:F-type H+-transporting ATPase subunit b
MNGYYLLANIGSDLVAAAQKTGEAFGFNRALFLSQVISFCVVAFLLHRFAYKPILKVLEDRKKRIADSLANAERIHAELAKAETARKEILDKAYADANLMLVETRAATTKVQEHESQKAVEAAHQILSKAREQSDSDRERMRADLMREMGRLVVQTTIKVTGKVLTAEDQKRLIDEVNREFASTK